MNPVQTSLIPPPKLESYDRLAVKSFIIEWMAYTDNIDRFNYAVSEERKLNAIPLRDYVVPWILIQVCNYILQLPAGSS